MAVKTERGGPSWEEKKKLRERERVEEDGLGWR